MPAHSMRKTISGPQEVYRVPVIRHRKIIRDDGLLLHVSKESFPRIYGCAHEYHHLNKYIRGLIGWIGFKQVPYKYARDPRFAGETKYTASRMMKLAADGLFSFSRKPLRLVVRLGLLSMLVALGLGVWAIIRRLLWGAETIPGWASTVAIVLFLGGVQLLSTGVLGEYIGSIFDESKRRPEYVVEELVNINKD